MALIYYQFVIDGKLTITDVPERVKEKVIKLLEENGYAELVNSED